MNFSAVRRTAHSFTAKGVTDPANVSHGIKTPQRLMEEKQRVLATSNNEIQSKVALSDEPSSAEEVSPTSWFVIHPHSMFRLLWVIIYILCVSFS